MAVLWTLANMYLLIFWQTLWVLKSKICGQKSTNLREIVVFYEYNNWLCLSKIGMILENIVFQKLNLSQVIFNKKWAPKLLFFGTFWRNLSHCIHKVQWFPLNIEISYLRYFSKVLLYMRKFAKEYLKPQSGQVNFQLSSLFTGLTSLEGRNY